MTVRTRLPTATSRTRDLLCLASIRPCSSSKFPLTPAPLYCLAFYVGRSPGRGRSGIISAGPPGHGPQTRQESRTAALAHFPHRGHRPRGRQPSVAPEPRGGSVSRPDRTRSHAARKPIVKRSCPVSAPGAGTPARGRLIRSGAYCGNKWRKGTTRASASARNTLELGRDDPRSKRARSVSESPARVASSAWLRPRSRRACCRRRPTCRFTASRPCCRSTRSVVESADCGSCATDWRICTGRELSVSRIMRCFARKRWWMQPLIACA